MKIASALCMLAMTLLFAFSCGTPAFAQATRTWVSGVGDDANPCSRTAPCKTFAGAISKTAAGGEINCLDPGGFGAVTITKSISLICKFEAGVLVSGTNGIVISALSTDRILLEGLDIEGLGTGLDGVKVLSAGVVEIRQCSIRTFRGSPGNGVNVVSNTPNGRVIVQDSFIAFNTGGVHVASSQPQVVSLINTVLDSNTSFAAQADGSGQILGAVNSTLLNSPTAISLLNGGTAISIGPSNVLGGNGGFSSTVPFK